MNQGNTIPATHAYQKERPVPPRGSRQVTAPIVKSVVALAICESCSPLLFRPTGGTVVGVAPATPEIRPQLLALPAFRFPLGASHSIPVIPEQLQELSAFYRQNLLHDCLPFWFPRCLDTQHGGYLHCLNQDGTIVDTDKSVWAQGRIAWMLLTLYNQLERRDDWLHWGKSGIDFLEQHGFDTDGRMFFHLTRDGQPIRKRRYAYSESFHAIACAAYAQATQQAQYADRALQLFDHFTDWNFTPGKMPPKFTDTRPLIGMGPRMITLITAQELRTSLGPQPRLESWIDRCLDEIERYFVKPDLQCVMEAVAPDGSVVDHFDTRTLNPGHAIEGAWFVMAEGKHRKDSRLIRLGCQMLDWMWQRGWDTEFGGLFEFELFGGRIHFLFQLGNQAVDIPIRLIGRCGFLHRRTHRDIVRFVDRIENRADLLLDRGRRYAVPPVVGLLNRSSAAGLFNGMVHG
ncbi:MAG: hypothetical protein RI897_823, partial [Verrucomicrobiota bacterium]